MSRARVSDASRPLLFEITKQHCKTAKCKDPNKCVIAQALTDALGDFLSRIEAGSVITKVWFNGKIVRYGTPKLLREALKHFDETGQWDLPEGKYKVLPPNKATKLGAKHSAGSKSGVRNPAAKKKRHRLPTRRVSHVNAAAP